MTNELSCHNHFLSFDKSLRLNAKKAWLVLWITTLTMLFEIYFGYTTHSMALLADGWHMATHAAALGITYLTYRLATNPNMVKNFNFGGGKIIALGGFASSIFLLCVVFMIGLESVERFFHPLNISFDEAILVAILGLAINVICAFILRASTGNHHSHSHDDHGHHSHSHGHYHDHNIRGAYLHVVADAVTSVGAIAALLSGKYFGFYFLDPLIGLIGCIIIFRWAIVLIKDTGWELLDGHAKSVDFVKLKSQLESKGSKILDLHVLQVAPKTLCCELVVTSQKTHGLEFYRQILHNEFNIQHSVIEER